MWTGYEVQQIERSYQFSLESVQWMDGWMDGWMYTRSYQRSLLPEHRQNRHIGWGDGGSSSKFISRILNDPPRTFGKTSYQVKLPYTCTRSWVLFRSVFVRAEGVWLNCSKYLMVYTYPHRYKQYKINGREEGSTTHNHSTVQCTRYIKYAYWIHQPYYNNRHRHSFFLSSQSDL